MENLKVIIETSMEIIMFLEDRNMPTVLSQIDGITDDTIIPVDSNSRSLIEYQYQKQYFSQQPKESELCQSERSQSQFQYIK